MIILFMEGLLPQILKRLRALQSLELTVKRKAWTWQSYCSCTTEAQGSHLFDREFLLLIKRELGHIKTITMTDYGKADNEGEGLCPWILEQLEKRNRAWTPQLAGGNRFVRTTCAMTTLNPVVFSSIGEIEYGWRRERGPYGVRHKKITPIPDVPRDVFH